MVGSRLPRLLSDVIQPYSAFTDRHVSMRAGLWVATPPGVSTLIGPLVNQVGPLAIRTGAIETDWHHFELFVVAEIPDFPEQVMMVDPGTPIAQLHFAARTCHETTELRFSPTDPGAEPRYGAAWDALGRRLVAEQRVTVAQRRGVGSIQLGCPHCYVSVTAAADGDLPESHILQRGFNPAYKILKQAVRECGLPVANQRCDG
jgi:hypothetical protein